MQVNATPAHDPRRFGKYVLLERIGRGGMAEVYRAKTYGAAGFVKECAIKKILSSLLDDEQFVRMFIDEAKLTARLTHANIVQVLDLGEIEGNLFIAMEYVEGKDLLDILARSARRGVHFPIELALSIAVEILKGLDFAHNAKGRRGEPMNIVHRDVSPSNVLISYDGQVKVGDFGIAKSQMQSSHTEVGTQKGKTGYMSPEQVTGASVDRRSDIFAVSVILFEMLTMTRLFKAKNDLDVMLKIRDSNVARDLERARSVSAELTDIIAKGLARDPDDRFQTAGEFLDALREFAQDNRLGTSSQLVSRFVSDLFADEIAAERERRHADPEDLDDVDSPLGDSRIPGQIGGRDWADLGAVQPARRSGRRRSQSETAERDLVGTTPTGIPPSRKTPVSAIDARETVSGPSPAVPSEPGAHGDADTRTPAPRGDSGAFASAAILRSPSRVGPIHVADTPTASAKDAEEAPGVSGDTASPESEPAAAKPPADPGTPAALEGAIGAVTTVRLVHRIATAKLSGRLGLSRDAVSKSFWFDGGELVAAESNDESDDLVELLIARGEITRAQASEARARAADGSLSLENAILGVAPVAPHTLFACIQAQLGDKLRGCLFWESGVWHWWPDAEVQRDPFGTVVDPIEMMGEAIGEEAEIRTLRRYYKAKRRHRLRLQVSSDALPGLRLSSRALRIIANLDDAPNVAEVVRIFCDRYNWSEADVYRTLFVLTEFEVLGFDDEPDVTLPGA
jgi:serine/threonine protein kinase